MRDDRLLRVVDQLYEAALEPGQWEIALSALTELLGGVAYAHFLWKKRTLQAPVFYSYGFPEQVRRDYLSYYSTIEPGAEYLLANPSHDCFTDTYWIDEGAMDRNEYHAWLKRETQIRHRLAAFVANNEDYLGITSLQLHHTHGPPTRTQVEHFRKLLPHIRRATRISEEFAGLSQERESWHEIFDQVGLGILLLDRSGRVVTSNRAAQAIVAQKDGFLLDRDGRCTAAHPAARGALMRLVAGVTSEPNDSADSNAVMTLARPSGKRSYVLMAIRLPASHAQLDFKPRPVAMVFISDPETHAETSETVLQRLFQLTRGEARLAKAILHAESLHEAAETLHITEGTARQVLKRVFQKTDTHSQAGLIKVLLNSSRPLGAERLLTDLKGDVRSIGLQ